MEELFQSLDITEDLTALWVNGSLSSFYKNTNTIVKPADKGGGIQ